MADVRNGAHHESAAEGRDTLVESTDLEPLDLSRDQVHMEWETVVVTRKVGPEREIDSQWGESHAHGGGRPLTSDGRPFPIPKGDREK